MTIGLYARRNRLPLENITVSLSTLAHLCSGLRRMRNQEGMLDRIDVKVELTGSLTAEQHAKTNAGRGQMSRSSDAHIRDKHQSASRGEAV